MSNKINYHKETCKIIDEIKLLNYRPRLLLHVCCAPCSSYVLEWLGLYFDIYIDFYNPNLDSMDEYSRRLKELYRLKAELSRDGVRNIYIIFGEYRAEDYGHIATKREHMPERGYACNACYALRLKHAATEGLKYGCDYFTTTLTISPMKSAEIMNNIGFSLQKAMNIRYLPSDFKKQNGYKRSVELSEQYSLYRQDYCGCVFSKKEQQLREKSKTNQGEQEKIK